MSRCFPFPPPGYELKARADDDVKLIIKDKKQKKHKDKKDKDKKEKKEKEKEKERSEGKTKDDKKRKREKHKDKKEKKKDRVGSLEEKKVVGFSENQNVEKLVPDNRPIDGIEDKRTFSELGDRVRNNGASNNKMVRKITFVEKSKVNSGQSVKVDVKSFGNGLVENCYKESNNKVKCGSSWDNAEKRKEGKERNGFKKRIGEGEGSEKEERNKNAEKKEKVTVSDFNANNALDHMKEDLNVFSHENGIPRNNLLCHQAGQVLPHEPLFSHQAGKNGILPNNICRLALQCNPVDQNGNGLRPPQSIMNLAVDKKDLCTNEKSNGKLSSPRSVIKNARTSQPCQNAKKSVTEFNNGCIPSHLVHIKRKVDLRQTTNGEKVEFLANGGKMIMQGSDVAHTTDSEKNPLLEIGAKMTLQEPDTLKSKEFRVNSISSKTLPLKLKVKEKIDASMMPPHPDLKFLDRILSIPQVEWAQCDDDKEWLFGGKDSEVKRDKLASPQNLVWAEAMMLESVDVTALPYVIPY